jgi:citrate lyase beta subunit
VEVVHTAFSPSVEDILASFTILKTFLTRQQLGEGVFQLDGEFAVCSELTTVGGRMIDLPLAIGAAKILQKAKLIEDKEEI